MIKRYLFGYSEYGLPVYNYVIENANGAKIECTQLGASIVSIIVPDKNGDMKDVVLGYEKIDGYEKGVEYFGTTAGRCCGRIANAKFSLCGKEYSLYKNDGNNHLHGGLKSFSRKVWDCEVKQEKLIFSLQSLDGDEGYPGNMTVWAIYSLDDDNNLCVEYKAVCDKDTICNLTNHSFFNLNGHDSGSINGHKLTIRADFYLPVKDDLIPTGEYQSVQNTPFDFTKAKQIGEGLNVQDSQLKIGNGYDHSFVIKKQNQEFALASTAIGDKSGIRLDCYTTNPILQLYVGNYVNQPFGKRNTFYGKNSGFCFETQKYSDAINQPNFPSTILKAGEIYKEKTVYSFSIDKEFSVKKP